MTVSRNRDGNLGQTVMLVDVVRDAWAWSGLVPQTVIASNDFGNLLIEDSTGCVWRLCPEELSCSVVASSRDELDALMRSEDFLLDWRMARLVEVAFAALGQPADGHCFCCKISPVLGGSYTADNFGTISVSELISASGHIALQVKDLPDGAKIRFQLVE